MMKKWIKLIFISIVLAVVLCGSLLLSNFWKPNNFFSTLTNIDAYAKTLSLQPSIDNGDLLHPDFTHYHRSIVPDWLTQLLHDYYIKPLAWTPDQFKELVKTILKTRIINGNIGRFVTVFKPKPGDKFIIWGGIHGAFHSLVRCLKNLQEQHIIDDHLRIINPNYYFVFNGNVINQSAYNLETLTLVLQLMAINEDHVFYIRGTDEDNQNWHNEDFHRELIVRAGDYSDELIPFDNVLTPFFATLPLALYLQGKNKNGKNSLVRISNYDMDNQEIQESRIAHCLLYEHEKPSNCQLPRVDEFQAYINLAASIHAINREFFFLFTNGLRTIGNNKGFLEWNVFSAPTMTFQNIHNFYNDAYALLDIQERISDWTISLFSQDARTQNGFTQSPAYNLISGIEEKKQKELDKKNLIPLILGSTIDLTRGLRIEGEQVKNTLDMCFDYARKNNLLPDKLPSIIVLDDQYRRENALANVERLWQQYHVNMILAPSGTPTLEEYLNLVKKKKYLVLFPLTGSPLFRSADLKNLINLRASYIDEAYLGTRYLLTTEKLTKFAFFYQDDEFGQPCVIAAQKALKEAGVKDYIALRYQRNDVNFDEQVKKCRKFNPDAICFFSTSIAAENFMRDLGMQHLSNNYLLGISDLSEERFRQFLRIKGLEVVITNVVPSPERSNLEIVKKFREMIKSYPQVSLDPSALETFIGCMFLFEIIKCIEGEITPEKIVNAIEQVKNYQFQGLTLNFEPKTRELLGNIWIDTWEDTDWVKVPVDVNAAYHTFEDPNAEYREFLKAAIAKEK